MMPGAQTLSPPSWVAMLPQKFSAATITGWPGGHGSALDPLGPETPSLPHPARRTGRTIPSSTPNARPPIDLDPTPAASPPFPNDLRSRIAHLTCATGLARYGSAHLT